MSYNSRANATAAALRVNAMLANKWSVLQSGKFSDVTISNGEREFKVHKAVICPQSSFFMAACDGDFQVNITEAKSGRIELASDDPDTVERMISYLYVFDYDDETYSNTTFQARKPAAITETTPNSGNSQEAKGEIGERPALFSAVRVYAIAEKYDIKGLKELAMERLSAWVETNWNHDKFPAMVREAYESTPGSDRGLRDIIERVLAKHATEVVNDVKFKDLLCEVGSLSLAILQLLAPTCRSYGWL
ncbi:MAG: hypothetical protein M1839_004603 [Geoglossum umbratile]|nr:MAG: hypothetical protein M1839_004603 [Geoglossum umbratile]